MIDQQVLYASALPRHVPWRAAARRIDSRLVVLALGLLLLITVAALLYVVQASKVAELRFSLQQAERERTELAEEIALLRYEVACSDRLATLEERIEPLGLVDAPRDFKYTVCYVPVSPVAVARVAAVPPAEARVAGAGILERLLAFLRPAPRLQAMRVGMP